MRDRLEEFYEQELFFIRRMAAEFARDRPKIADRLAIGPETRESSDPHVERLIESFAFLTARVRLKMEDEFPELTSSLMSLLYPHYLAPIPSLSIAQFVLDPNLGKLTEGYTVPRKSRLVSREVMGIPCRFRTAYPVTLWPLEMTTTYMTAPFGSGIKLPPGLNHVEAMVRLQIRVSGSLPWSDLNLDQLRVCLSGDEKTTHQLYELIFNHCAGVFLRDGGGLATLLPADSIKEVGFGPDEGLLPYDPRSFAGYRLLTEYFSFPQKFLFADFTGLRSAVAKVTKPTLDLCVLLDKADRTLESRVDSDCLKLGCTPIVNLFNHQAEPIRLTQTQTEYHVIPDVRHRRAFEVYSVDSVTTTNLERGTVTEYEPFFACRHGRSANRNPTYWHSTRKASPDKKDKGTEVWLSLVDLDFDPSKPAAEVISIATTCSNRDLPGELRTSGGVNWGFQLEGQAPIKRIDPIIPPTLPSRIPEGELRWRLISHLALNHFSITDGESGADALRELLKLYDYNHVPATAQQIAGIDQISSRRKTARIPGGQSIGFCRGIEIEMTFDPEKYVGVGAYLMASVLDKFVGLYASINSFTRLTTRMRNSAEPFKVWPCRVGDQTIL